MKRLHTFEANERNNHSKSFKPLAADASVFLPQAAGAAEEKVTHDLVSLSFALNMFLSRDTSLCPYLASK